VLVNLLLVDDRPENLVVLEELLDQPDRKLIKATSGSEALRLLFKHDVALVLLGLQMPGMDGYEVAQLMRAVEGTRLVPIIFITAGGWTEEEIFRGYEAGAVDFLYKPINAHTLRSKVNVFIELHRKTRELERTTAALRDKVTDLENVSHTLSHDLRAPLRSIRAFAEILAEQQDRLDAEGKDALSRVLKASERMAQMVDDLYRLLRLSGVDVVSSEVNAVTVLDEVVAGLSCDLESAHAMVTHDALPTVLGNPVLLAQIFQNLIANSIKFHGAESPRIHVGAERVASDWQFSVRDNGIGIPASEREHVFRLFHRLSNAGGGTGIGLTLCKRAVEKLGGKIWVGPDNGPGATFYFTIPDRQP